MGFLRSRRLWMALAHVGGFIALLLLFIYLTFPTEAVRQVLERMLSTRVGRPVKIGGLSLYGLSGIELESVMLTLPQKAPLGGLQAKARRKVPILVDRVTVRGDLLGMARSGTGKLSIEAEVFDGKLGAREVRIEPGKVDVIGMHIEDVDLRARPVLRAFIPLDLRAQIEGKGKLAIRDRQVASAAFELKLSDTLVREPKVPSPLGPLDVSDVHLGGVGLKVEFRPAGELKSAKRRYPPKARVLVVRDLEVRGADVMALVEDQATIVWMRPNDPVGAGQLDGAFAFRVAPRWLDKEVVDKRGRKSRPNSLVRSVLKDPRLRRATRNGWIGFRCTGLLARAGCTPAMPSANVARVRTFAPPPKKPKPAAKKPVAGKGARALPARAGRGRAPGVRFGRGSDAGRRLPTPTIRSIPGAGSASSFVPSTRAGGGAVAPAAAGDEEGAEFDDQEGGDEALYDQDEAEDEAVDEDEDKHGGADGEEEGAENGDEDKAGDKAGNEADDEAGDKAGDKADDEAGDEEGKAGDEEGKAEDSKERPGDQDERLR